MLNSILDEDQNLIVNTSQQQYIQTQFYFSQPCMHAYMCKVGLSVSYQLCGLHKEIIPAIHCTDHYQNRTPGIQLSHHSVPLVVAM